MSRKKYQENDKSLGARLRKFRKSRYDNTDIFLNLLNISQGSLSAYENNKTIISGEAIINLKQNTDINIDWLLTGEGEMARQGDESDVLIYNKVGETGEDPEIAELLSSAKKVLDSGTDRAETLAVNIRSSCQWVIKDREAENRVMLALDEIKDRLADLEQVAHPPKKVCQIIRDGDDDTRRGEILKKRKA